MRLDRSKEWWLAKIDQEPDGPISAGIPDRPKPQAGKLLMLILTARAKLAWVWRLGIIRRTTAFRWEVDRALGEWTARATPPEPSEKKP